MNSHWVHVLEHLMFMGAAVLMWWPIASMMPELPRLAYPLQMTYLFLLSVAQLIVFAPVTFSSEPLYRSYVEAPRIWEISALTDQQMGGIIMKMGGAVLFLTLIIVLFFRWFGEQERRREAEEAERGLEEHRPLDGREPEETRLLSSQIRLAAADSLSVCHHHCRHSRRHWSRSDGHGRALP